MVSNVIYIMCIAFLILARDVASMESRRKPLKIQNEEDDELARSGGNRRATRVIFKPSRFQTVRTLGSVGQPISFQSLKGMSPVRFLVQTIFFFTFPNSIFSIFSIFSLFLHYILITFIILFMHHKIIKKIFF